MDYSLVIAGGSVVTPRGIRIADMGVRSGKIVKLGAMGKRARQAARRVVDASGCFVMPGAIDPHVHLDLPIGPRMTTSDDFDTGTRAAVAGGVTTIIDYTTPKPGQGPLDAFRKRRALADPVVRCDYGLHNVLIGWDPKWKSDLAKLVKLGAPSVKMFMIYADRGWQADDGMLTEVMEQAKRLGMQVCVHAENDSLISHYTDKALGLAPKKRGGAFALSLARPAVCEEEAAARAIFLAKHTGAKLHLVHLSTAGAVESVRDARQQGLKVTAETCPQYLALDAKMLSGPQGHKFGSCPPLRTARHRRTLFRALDSGWIDVVGTDHCTFTSAQKNTWRGDFRKIPYGLPGLETMLRVTWTLGPARGKMSIERWVSIHTEGPAKTFGLWPQKGSLQMGTDADILVWDPSSSASINPKHMETHTDWNPYQGKRLKGIARHVFLRGMEVASESKCLRRPIRGRYVLRHK